MSTSVSVVELLALAVRVHGVTLGHPVDLLLEGRPLRGVGLDVACRDGSRRFLPLPAFAAGDAHIALESPLHLLADTESGFYRRRARSFTALKGRAVVRGGRRLGILADVLLAADGTVTALVAESPAGRIEVPPEPGVTVGGEPLRAA